MLNFKPFAVHYNMERRRGDNAKTKSRPRGFTAWVEPSTDGRNVNLRIVHCAYHDDFNKKLGRSLAEQQPEFLVNARDVPEYLAAAMLHCWCQQQGQADRVYSLKYTYVWKYML